MAGFPARFLPVGSLGRAVALDYRTGSSTALEHSMKMERRGFETRPEYRGHLLSAFFKVFSTGRRIGLSLHKREVAGSSPASGHQCRSSSEVERVKFQFALYPSVLAGRRL